MVKKVAVKTEKKEKKNYRKPKVEKKENLKEITLLSFTPPSE